MADASQQGGGEEQSAGEAQGTPGGQPTQEELRQRLEEQLRKVRIEDMLLESVASILNLAARRIAKEDERDLDQARLGIDAVRALVEMLPPEPRQQVKAALTELQMLYARTAGGGGEEGGPEPGGEEPPGGGRPDPEQRRPEGGPGAGGRSSGLWTPPGSA